MARRHRQRSSSQQYPPDQVAGPHWEESRSRWSVRWIDDGRRRRKTFRERDEAERFAAELRSQAGEGDAAIAAAVVGELGPSDGTAAWWNRALGHAAGALLAAVSAGDERGMRLLGRASNALAGLARAASGARELAREENEVRDDRDTDGDMPMDTANAIRAVFGIPPFRSEAEYAAYNARQIDIGDVSRGAGAPSEPAEPN